MKRKKKPKKNRTQQRCGCSVTFDHTRNHIRSKDSTLTDQRKKINTVSCNTCCVEV